MARAGWGSPPYGYTDPYISNLENVSGNWRFPTTARLCKMKIRLESVPKALS